MKNELTRKTYIEIDMDTLTNNVDKIITEYKGYNYYIGVVKGNVYGHGSYAINAFLASGVNYLAVSSLEEALNIRKINKEVPILCLEPICLDFALLAHQNNITLTVSSLDYLKKLTEIIKDKTLKIHIKINSGMNRLGFSKREEIEEAFHIISDNYTLEGIFTHLATLGISDPYYDMQINKFLELTKNIDLTKIPIIHIGRSLTLLNHPKIPFCNGIRLGILMYGFNQSPKKDESLKGSLRQIKADMRIKKYHISKTTLDVNIKVEEAFSLYTEVMEIQKIKKGESTGYGVSYKALEDEYIAICPIGYADGFSRRNSGRFVWINDKKYQIVGSINMGMIQIKIDENVNIGDKVELLGKHIPVSYASKYIDTTPYECMCMMHESIPRVYIEKGKIISIEKWEAIHEL